MKSKHWHYSWRVVQTTFINFANDKGPKLAAALAYYTVFSIGPLLMVIIGATELVLGKDAISGQLFTELSGLIGRDAAAQVQETVRNNRIHQNNVLLTAVGIISLIIGASSVFVEVQDSINLIWGLRTKPKKGLMKLLMNRLLSFSLIAGLGFVLLVSLLVNAAMVLLSNRLGMLLGGVSHLVVLGLNYMLTFIVISSLFTIIFKVLPDAHIRWRDVAWGALATSLLFILGKFLIGFYLGRTNVVSTYGGAGSVIIVLLWIYFSAIILYLGAEFTQARMQHLGRKIEPADYVELVPGEADLTTKVKVAGSNNLQENSLPSGHEN